MDGSKIEGIVKQLGLNEDKYNLKTSLKREVCAFRGTLCGSEPNVAACQNKQQIYIFRHCKTVHHCKAWHCNTS